MKALKETGAARDAKHAAALRKKCRAPRTATETPTEAAQRRATARRRMRKWEENMQRKIMKYLESV